MDLFGNTDTEVDPLEYIDFCRPGYMRLSEQHDIQQFQKEFISHMLLEVWNDQLKSKIIYSGHLNHFPVRMTTKQFWSNLSRFKPTDQFSMNRRSFSDAEELKLYLLKDVFRVTLSILEDEQMARWYKSGLRNVKLMDT